jgi:hypothetical protein
MEHVELEGIPAEVQDRIRRGERAMAAVGLAPGSGDDEIVAAVATGILWGWWNPDRPLGKRYDPDALDLDPVQATSMASDLNILATIDVYGQTFPDGDAITSRWEAHAWIRLVKDGDATGTGTPTDPFTLKTWPMPPGIR